jgi:ferric enterobactin receptor
MKRSIAAVLVALSVCCMYTAKAQVTSSNILQGKIVDSTTQHPLEYATVTLFLKGKAVNGATTDKNGMFKITDVKDTVYNIVFEFLGYKSYTLQNVKVNSSNSPWDVKTILLSRRSTELEGVTVVSQGKLVENKIDKTVFNAERDLTSQSGVATDVLKKVPQVSVDADGNVQLAGSGGIRFLINGKPSTAFGSNITDVLQSIPASQIKSIEVITNPGAKYDAAGMGGIINIILKSSKAQGYNGNVALTVGSLQQNGSLNLNIRKNNIGFNVFSSGNYRLKRNRSSVYERLSSDPSSGKQTLLHEDGNGSFSRNGFQTGLGFDWTINKNNSLTASLAYNNFSNKNETITIQDQQYYNGSTLSHIISLINSNNNNGDHSMDASLSYKRIFKEDQELEVAMNSSISNARLRPGANQFLLPLDSLYYGNNSYNEGKEKETEINVDYIHPISEDVKLGIGSKVAFYDINSGSSVLRYEPSSKQYEFNPSLSTDLDYQQKVYAFYSEISFPIPKLVDVKLGARYERTEISSYYSNAAQQVKVPGYNTLVPSIFFSKKIADGQSVRLSYSKRIERPDYNDLNPFVNAADPKNLSVGNPYLLPELGHRIELGYTLEMKKAGTVSVTAFYRINEHDIQPYINFYSLYKIGDSTYSNVSVSSRQNIGMEKNAGLSLFADVHVSAKFNVRSNLFFFHRHTINVLDPQLDANSFNYRFNINTSCQVTPTLAGEFFGNFNSSRHEAQGSYPSFTSYTFAIRKQFWNKKGSLAFTANNVFSENVRQQTQLYGSNFSVTNVRYIPFRSFGLNFTWKFGKLEFKSKKEEGENINTPAE